jgi:hypothetical protein
VVLQLFFREKKSKVTMRPYILLPAAIALLAPSVSEAMPLDLQLYKLSYFDSNDGRYHGDQGGFRALANELGLVFAPKFLAPASTTGEAGFELGLETSMTTIKNGKYYWKNAVEGGTPPSVLTTEQLHLRKGLPESFELGVAFTYLFQSQMFAVGAEVKWAFNEGFKYAPDLAVRGGVNRVIGSRDLDLTVAGFDFCVSKTFGILGSAQITPYIGYDLALVWAGSRVLNATQGDNRDDGPEGSNKYGVPMDQFAFDREFIVNHRGFLGVRLKADIAVVAYELVYSGNGQFTNSVKVAVDF